jgi:hypothetical protein
VSTQLFSQLGLRSGRVLENRIAKAAMEENMAGREQLPDERLFSLDRRWGVGGAGLLITGNVMVHAEALTGPGGVVLNNGAPLQPFADWAKAGKSAGAAMCRSTTPVARFKLRCRGSCGHRRQSVWTWAGTPSASAVPLRCHLSRSPLPCNGSPWRRFAPRRPDSTV